MVLTPVPPVAACARSLLPALAPVGPFLDWTSLVQPAAWVNVLFLTGTPYPASSIALGTSVVMTGSVNVERLPVVTDVPFAVPTAPTGQKVSTPLYWVIPPAQSPLVPPGTELKV